MEEKSIIKEDELSQIAVDLGTVRKGQLNESWLAMFGGWVKWILKGMFGGSNLPVKVVGTRSEVDSFAKALAKEKDYMSLISKYGLDDARTYKSRFKVEKAASEFQRKTGLKWPFR